MKELIDWKEIIIIFVTAVITFFCNNIVNRVKIRAEQNIGFRTDVGKTIAQTLDETRRVLYQLRTIEVYDIENRLDDGEQIDFFDNPCIYPAILNDLDSLFSFCDDIRELRQKSELYLSRELAAYIWILERYLCVLTQFVSQKDLQGYCSLIGTFVIFDLQKWLREFDAVIVKSMNKVHCRLETKSGRRWEREKCRLRKQFWEKSILYKVINLPESKEAKLIKKMIAYEMQKNEDKEANSMA